MPFLLPMKRMERECEEKKEGGRYELWRGSCSPMSNENSSQSIFHIPPLPLLSHYLSRFTSIVHLAKHCNKKFSLPSNPVSHRHALLCRLGRSHGS